MAHGIPVIASNRTSHPEVAGEAALLVEPTTEDLATGLVRLAADADLRTDLAARGRARAAQFPWSRTARLTVETYRAVLNS
jgi:glycosyltransferase involved in cell wall biosynthesis